MNADGLGIKKDEVIKTAEKTPHFNAGDESGILTRVVYKCGKL